jgi:outer membrane protein assembly factor BamB
MVALSLLLLAAAAVSAAEPKYGSWPQWRGPNRDGKSPEKGLLTTWEASPPKLEWTANGFGEGYASVTIGDGKLFTTGNFKDGQKVVCANAADGAILWSSKITDKAPSHGYEGARCSPSIDGGFVYAIGSNGSIACLKIADGSLVWQKDFQKEWKGQLQNGWGFSESPLVDGDRVLCTPGSKDAMVVALNKKTGEEIWRCKVPDFGGKGSDGAGYSSMVISNGGGTKQYVQLIGRGVIGVRASDGKFLWGYNEVANGTANIPSVLCQGDYVFASSGYGTGAALLKLSSDGDGVKAEEEYFLPANKFQNHHGGMVMVGDYIYAGHGHNEGFPICLQWKTGEVAWGGKKRGPGSGSAGVVYADGNLIFRYQNGEVALIEATPDEYKLKGSFKPAVQERESWAHPVVAGGRLYLREQNKLMCYDLKK